MSDLEGVILSDYQLVECISKGGIADVYRGHFVAEDGEAGERQDVVVKVYRPTYAQRAPFRDYFMAEAEKIARLNHPHILPFVEYGEGEDLLYLVMPYVASGTLENLLLRVGGRLSAMQALPIIQQLCDAVQYAHDNSVIHGNIKPTNVFIAADGRLLLADFAIARGYDDSQQSLTRIGWGSAEYVAPEQSLGIVKRGSDIYALGVLLFRILTGSPPFLGQTPVEVLLKHVRQEAPSARAFVPNISDAVDMVLQRALQKRSEDRFASAEELRQAFAAAALFAPIASPVARAVPAIARQPRRPGHAATFAGSTRMVPLSARALPQTPIPPSISFAVLLPGQTIVAQYAVTERAEGAERMAEEDDDETLVRKKNFLQEDTHSHDALFWSADPAEWSPIAQNGVGSEHEAVPLSAGEYLEQKEVVLVEPQVAEVLPEERVIEQTETTEVPQAAESVEMAERDEQPEGQSFAHHLHRLLPVIVVILLVIGLLGALLSAFFLPVNKSGTNMRPSEPVSSHEVFYEPGSVHGLLW